MDFLLLRRILFDARNYVKRVDMYLTIYMRRYVCMHARHIIFIAIVCPGCSTSSFIVIPQYSYVQNIYADAISVSYYYNDETCFVIIIYKYLLVRTVL